MPFGWTDREKLQAYVDEIRKANPKYKGTSDYNVARQATLAWDPQYDKLLAEKGALSDLERAEVEGIRKAMPRPSFNYARLKDMADKGEWYNTALKGVLEGVDPIGVYRPLYADEDAASGIRTAGNLVGGIGTALVPVGGWAATGAKALRVAKLLKGEKQAELLGKIIAKGLPTAIDAAQAQSQYRADSKQLGLDYDIGTGGGLAALGGVGGYIGRAGQGVSGLKGAAMRSGQVPVLADMQMGTSPYLSESPEFHDTAAPARFPKAIAMALGKAEGVGDVAETLGSLALPAAMGAYAARSVGTPIELPKFEKPGGGHWGDPTGQTVARPAAVAPPSAGATAAQGSPTQRVRELLGDAPPGSSVWDDAVADEVNRSSARYSLTEALNAANVEGQPKVFVINPQTGDRMQMVRPMGGNTVIVGRTGETPKTMGVETARAMPMEAIIDVGKPGGTKAYIPPGFMPGYKDGPGGNQYRSFTLKDDQTGAESMALVVGHNSDTDEIIVLDTATGRTIKGHKSVFPEAAKIWAAPPEDKAGNIAKGMRADQRRHAGLEPHRLTTPADVLSAIQDAGRRIGF